MKRQRRPEVEAELREAIRLSPSQWVDAAHRLRAETIGALAREAKVQGRPEIFGSLILQHLHRRAIPIAAHNARGLSSPEAQEVVEKTLHLITESLLCPTQDIHYIEISFGSFVKRKAINFARDARRRGAGTENVLLSEEEDPRLGIDPQELERERWELFRTIDVRLALDKTLPKFSDEMRSAFNYWYFDGLPIETNDPEVLSISKLARRDKRTIYLWFRKIFNELRQELGEQDER
ncbi:MAG TPA: hypothetical protein VNM24_07015 [Burkholderiales bacterium]|nr:hypothetical protein [Burkholderiales bacterium]